MSDSKWAGEIFALLPLNEKSKNRECMYSPSILFGEIIVEVKLSSWEILLMF